ncbi:hypothetical protein DFH06DRAFT_1374145 [Mycena polygramma]|nr:hypothetical protein DFH06DRAFT_1374145 [Mycena polygramma]
MAASLRGVFSMPFVPAEILNKVFVASLRTPRLWNNVRLLTDRFVGGRETFVKEILARSCHAPLSITLATSPDCSVTGMGNDVEKRWLDIVWDSSHRLRHISLDIHPEDAGSQTFPRHTAFPQLSLLDILIIGDGDADTHAIFDSFGDTAKPFVWYNDDLPPPPDICTLRHLSELDVSIAPGTGVADILDAFSFPQLTSLSIASSAWPGQQNQSTESLLAVHARSQFPLTHLSLVRQDLTLPNFILLLGVLPTLETLLIKHCDSITESLFEMLARHPAAPADAPALTHLHLAVFEIRPVNRIDGGVVARAVEYLAACAGESASAFPDCALKPEDDGEERVAAICATGFLVNRYQ